MTLKEIAAIAMDEADAEASMAEETVVMDAPSPAPGGKPPSPAPGASPAPGGTPPQQRSAPSGKSGAAQKLESDLAAHDARFHKNGFDPRRDKCKFREKMAAQAKTLGIADIKGLGVSATGESVDAVKNTDAWKDYQTQRNAIDENFRKKLKEKGLRENLNDNMTDLTDDEKAALKEYHQQIDAERDGYIRQTLGDAEADCVDQLADFMKEGGERAAKAKEVAERIRDQFPEGDPRHEGALKVIEMSTRAELLDSSLKIVGEIKEASVAEPEQQPSVEEPSASPPSPDGQSQIAQSQTPSPQPSAQEQQPSDAPTAQNSPEPENFGTIKGTDKEYVDLSGMDFWSSIKAAFDAGFAGKEIVTKLDKMKGRWDEIQASDPKVKEQMDALKGGMQEHMLSEAEKDMFTNLLSRDDLTDIQKDEIKDYQKMLSEAKSASDRVKARRQIRAYLKSEGIVDDKDSEKVKPKPMRESTYDGPVAGIGLLGTPTNSTGSKSKADQAGKDIEDKFKKLGIDAKLESVRPGPAVARAVFEVGDGFNWGNLKNKALKEALASASGAQDVSLERVPGEKNKIAANIKNSKREYVTAADVVNSTAWKDMMAKGAQLPVAIGKAADGRDLCADMTKLTHLLVTGETNSGKSVALNTMITSLLAAVGPGKVRLAMADPKKTEFSNYESNPALGWPVAKDAKSGASLIASIRAEMERRKDIIGLETEEFDPSWDDAKRKEYEETLEKGGRNIADYNKNNPDSNLDYLVCCIDELAEITKDPTYGPQAKADLDQIMALGRALGIHCILSTQRATVDSVPGSIKANIPSKLVFKAKNATDSVSALGHGGAENLLSEGDGIFEPRGGNEVNFQGAFTSDSVINGVQKFYRDNWRTGDAAKTPAPAPTPSSASEGAGAKSPSASAQPAPAPSPAPTAPTSPAPTPAPSSASPAAPSPAPADTSAGTPASAAPTSAPTATPTPAPTSIAPAQPPAAPQIPKGIQYMVDSSKQSYDAARQRYSQSRSADDLAAMQSAQSAYHDAVRASRGHATAESNLTKARTDYEAAQKALDDAVMNGGDETAAQRKLDAASKALQTARASYDAVEKVNKRGDLELRKGQPWESGKDAPVTNLENGMSLAVKNANGGVTTRIRRNDKGIIEVEQGGKWSKAKDQDKAEKSIKNYLTAHTQDGKGLKNITYNGNGEFVATQNRAAVESSSPIVQDELFPAMDSAAISRLLDDDLASLFTETEETE